MFIRLANDVTKESFDQASVGRSSPSSFGVSPYSPVKLPPKTFESARPQQRTWALDMRAQESEPPTLIETGTRVANSSTLNVGRARSVAGPEFPAVSVIESAFSSITSEPEALHSTVRAIGTSRVLDAELTCKPQSVAVPEILKSLDVRPIIASSGLMRVTNVSGNSVSLLIAEIPGGSTSMLETGRLKPEYGPVLPLTS